MKLNIYIFIILATILVSQFLEIQGKVKQGEEKSTYRDVKGKSKTKKKTLSQEEFKNIFNEQTNWTNNKQVKIQSFNGQLNTVFENNNVQSPFKNGISEKNIPKQVSYFESYTSIATFDFVASAVGISLDDFIIDFAPENPDEIDILIQHSGQEPNNLDEFVSIGDYVKGQKKFIQEQGLVEKADKNQFSNGLAGLFGRTKRQAFIAMDCKVDSGYQKIKGKFYPYLFQNDPEGYIEFFFYKDCNYEQNNEQITVDVQHYCHHHNINEFESVWEHNGYTDKYKQGGDDKGEANTISIEDNDPKILLKVQRGNQIFINPQVKKISGKNSKNMLKLKGNYVGGYATPNRVLDFQIATICKEKVGIEKYEFSVEAPPYDEKLSLILRTDCGEGNDIKNFTDFPLVIGVDESVNNVQKFSKTQSDFDIVNNQQNLYVAGKEQRQIIFNYGVTQSEKGQSIIIDAHNPTVTVHDPSVVSVLVSESGDTSITGNDHYYLGINMRCQKAGSTYIDVLQSFDYIEKNVKKETIEFGFKKVCSGKDTGDFNRASKQTDNVLKYFIVIVIVLFALYGIRLMKYGPPQEDGVNNQRLPTTKNQYEEVPLTQTQGVQRRNV